MPSKMLMSWTQSNLCSKYSFVYVIGGIVDHNRLKKITYDYAK